MTTKKPLRTFTATHPTTGEPLTSQPTTREVKFFTFGYIAKPGGDFEQAGWYWIGVTTQSDPLKAKRAGRSTNPYYHDYRAVPAVEAATAPEKCTSFNCYEAYYFGTYEGPETAHLVDSYEVWRATRRPEDGAECQVHRG